MDGLTVGRVVHYVSYGTPGGEYQSECRAAIVTAVHRRATGALPTASLCVLNPTGFFFNQDVPFSDDHDGGSWHWPDRV